MILTRRGFLAAAAMSGLAACQTGVAGSVAPNTSRNALPPSFRPQPNAAYDAWVASFRARAQARGISAATLDRAFRGQGFLPGVIERDRNQTEFKRSLEDYIALVAPEGKIPIGKRAVSARAQALAAVEGRYGVSRHIVGAIWGVESYFGTRRGELPVISATSTLAWEGRRGAFFEANLLAALRILEAGEARPEQLVGSWAGAMGHTQMIPSTYQRVAVDFNGDGRRDIWSDDPTDSFATTANLLAKAGWQRGVPWGVEVTLPQGFQGPVGRGARRAIDQWRAAGVRAARGGSLPNLGAAALLAPMGFGRPAFLVSRNFDVLLRYNNSENYALGVGYLSDRLAGQGPLVGSFGKDRYGLDLKDRMALQRGLTRAGFDAGTPDGVLGKKTEAAIRGYQKAKGLPVTGKPSPALLQQVG